LASVAQLLAPFTPFLSEEIYRNLTGEPSVHLSQWPTVGKTNLPLEEEMHHLREIVELGHSFRKTNGITLRQPLAKLSVSGFEGFKIQSNELIGILAEELNVKEIEFCPAPTLSVKFETDLTDELRAEGTARELVRSVQELRKEANLKLTDKITVEYPETKENKLAIALFSDLIRRETLALHLKPAKLLKIWKKR